MNETKMATVIFFDREDVESSSKVSYGAHAITLSPSASLAAQEAGLDVCEATSLFVGASHARCAALAHRTLKEFDQATIHMELPASVALMARQSAWSHANLVERLRRSLPPGPWIARNRYGVWVKATDWTTLQAILLPRIWDYGLGHRMPSSRPLFPGLFKRFTQLAASLARRRSKYWVASSSRKLKNGLQDSLLDTAACVAVFQPTHGGWSDYRSIFADLRSSKTVRTFPISPLRQDESVVKIVIKKLEMAGRAFSDPRVLSAWQLYAPYFEKILPAMLGITAEGPTLMRVLAIRSAVTYEANSWLSASLMEAAGTLGVNRVVFNHNSQPSCDTPIADSVLKFLFEQRTCNELVDIAALWSPASENWPRSGKTRVICVKLQYPTSTSAQKGRKLQILHAGNYQNWSDFFPWIAQTADEYLKGLITLANVVEQLEGVELVVRVRPKREVDAAAVARVLGNRRNVTICGVEQDFLVQLAGSDLLVAHFSTTIEQALQMGKLVLQWGSANRYEQFRGQQTPPAGTFNDRVYTAHTPESLEAMLLGIRDSLDEYPKVADNINPYGFDIHTQTVEDLARYLLTPEVKLPTSEKELL